jgi:hypothetical protein
VAHPDRMADLSDGGAHLAPPGARAGTGRTPPPPPSGQGSRGWRPNASLIALSDPQAESAPKPDGRSGHESPGGATKSKQPPEPESLLEVQEDKAQRETQEQLHATVPLAKPTAKVGESCKHGTPGCGKNKKFNGVFFGAEE